MSAFHPNSTIRGWCILVLILLFCGCTRDRSQQVLQSTLRNGDSLQSVVKQKSVTLLVVMEPGHCFSCDPALLQLLRTRPLQGRELVVVASTSPSRGEKTMLQLHRISIAAILREPAPDSLILLLLDKGRVVDDLRNPSPGQIRSLHISLTQ